MRKKICIAFLTACILAFSILANSEVKNMEVLEKLQKQLSNNKDSNVKNIKNVESNLPVIYLETDGKQIYKDVPIWSNISVVYPNSYKKEYSVADFTTPATVKYRGNSSYYTFDKRQYRIAFYEKTKSKDKANYELLGMGKHNEWVLNGPFLDRTLIRNHLMYGLSKDIMDWAPDSHFCEVYLDGEYQGVYLAVEPITNGETRLRLSEFSLLSGDTPFVIKRERVGTEENVLHTFGELNGYTSNELSIQYPSNSDLTKVQTNWINQYINNFEQVLYGDKFTDPKEGYEKYIDVDSFVDYFIINESSMNADAGELSTYCYRELGGKMYMTVWDFNNSYNNYMWDDKEYDKFFTSNSPWFDRLLQDRSFVDKVQKRYKELRETVLSDENILKNIDDDRTYLGKAIDRNFDVWGYTFNEKLLSTAKDGTVRDPRNYDEAVSQLKDAVRKRFSFLDKNLDMLYKNCIN